MDHGEFVNHYLAGIEDIVKKISKEDIDSTIELLFEAWKNDRAVSVAGNGGSV